MVPMTSKENRAVIPDLMGHRQRRDPGRGPRAPYLRHGARPAVPKASMRPRVKRDTRMSHPFLRSRSSLRRSGVAIVDAAPTDPSSFAELKIALRHKATSIGRVEDT